MVNSLLQILVNVTDLERAIDFYVNVLGVQFVERPTPEFASLSLSGIEIGLFMTDERSPYLQRTPNGSRAGATLTLNSTDIKADRHRLEAAGAVIIDDRAYPWGHIVVFEDTEGNVLRLMTESPARIQRRSALPKRD